VGAVYVFDLLHNTKRDKNDGQKLKSLHILDCVRFYQNIALNLIHLPALLGK
jgi:hypothetical protein